MLLALCAGMLVTAGITTFLFLKLVDEILVSQIKAQLQTQADKIVQTMDSGWDIKDLDNEEFKWVLKDRLFYADYFVTDIKGRIIASSESSRVGHTLAEASITRHKGTMMLDGRRVVYTSEKLGTLPFRLFIYYPLAMIRSMYVPLFKTTILAVAASFLFILIIGWLSVGYVVRPLNRLKEAVGRYDPHRGTAGDFPGEDDTEIGQLAGTFRSMSERIAQHQQGQQEFLQNVSHELKTPLMSIQGYAMAIQDEVVTQEDGLNVIASQSVRLVQMVEKLLQLSRLETLEENWKPSLLDLRDIAEEAVHLLLPTANERGISLTIEGSGIGVLIPGEQLFQIIVNLLQNAVRHAHQKVELIIERGEGWAIHIDDDGPGLSFVEREAIFRRYYKGLDGGTGLGLAICQQIALRLGDELSCTSSKLGGARFTYRRTIK
ncbi:sensor histidine kinase [Paenibacillus zanthoxyli]|uniref:sensor histidine kinase n=1 Tax=Paenibacillus zanthoxyli TaxID=369399 RepID=UPI0004B54229|nr:HAMP domain-containing sensor histidine kinase [Paenibacillus zanthoxyli]